MPIPFKSTALITIMMISTPLIVAVVVLAVGRVEKSTALFHVFHRPVFHSPEFAFPKPELTLGIDLCLNLPEIFTDFSMFNFWRAKYNNPVLIRKEVIPLA